MTSSAIIVAGGFSKRYGQDKGLLQLFNKPLVKHVLDAVDEIANEKLVVVSSTSQAQKYREVVNSDTSLIVDKSDLRSPLIGALTGFQQASGDYSLLLPCDTPFVSKSVLSLLLELCITRNAAIPRWPNCYIEPLQAAYRTRPAIEAAEKAVCKGEMNMQGMVDKLAGVRYVSTLVLRQLDPDLTTFFNINTPIDLKKAERLLRSAGYTRRVP